MIAKGECEFFKALDALSGRSAGKSLLTKIFVMVLANSPKRKDESYLSQEMQLGSEEELRAHILRLEGIGHVKKNEQGDLELTEEGRKKITVVMTGGAFDIIHPGHIETLEKAKALGDALIVSVARNSTYLRNKKRNPLHDEVQRKKMVESIKFVDATILGSEVDIYETVRILRPDIIALGYDQAHSEATIKVELEKRGLSAKVVRLDSSTPSIKTSRIAQDYY